MAGVSGAPPGSARVSLPASIHPSIQKHRRLAALDPYGHTDTLCKAKVLHLRTCSAPWAPCLPCQCPGRARGPGSPSLSKSSDRSGSETDPSHSGTSVPRAWQRDWRSLQLSSARPWVPQEPPAARCGEQTAPRQLVWQHPAVPSTAPFRDKICPCSAGSRLRSQRFATALDSVTVLQQGYKAGTSKGLRQALSPQSCTHVQRGLRRGRGSCPGPRCPRRSGVRRGGAARRGGGRTRGGRGGSVAVSRVPLSSMHAHTLRPRPSGRRHRRAAGGAGRQAGCRALLRPEAVVILRGKAERENCSTDPHRPSLRWDRVRRRRMREKPGLTTSGPGRAMPGEPAGTT